MVGGNSLFKQNNKLWGTVLGVLLLGIVCLAIAIVATNTIRSDERPSGAPPEDILDRIGSTNLAIEKCEEIKDLFRRGVADKADADRKYRDEFSSSDSIYKVYVAMCYADFAYENGDGMDRAVEIMKSVEPLPEDNTVKMDYYVKMIDLYQKVDDAEMIDYYKKIMNEGGAE